MVNKIVKRFVPAKDVFKAFGFVSFFFVLGFSPLVMLNAAQTGEVVPESTSMMIFDMAKANALDSSGEGKNSFQFFLFP
ncbi:MAG: hypothetical protein HON43_02975 [Alphaproteobacteria bacterium]|jgi:hypothetical protein|nr:hypothetical protein [Alphaproteobacteria bacterium]MBT5390033.1 hypothetical protein [Alphaproteobacteria bacterium]MBT5540663.1 hypothetical protein [Alphaproteobacteria bacterium]